jgi:hypothetical protein
MMPGMHGFVLLLMFASLPPLSDAQTQRLSHAVDGNDHREDAFLALIENARAHETASATVESPATISDWSTFANDPAKFRGQLFHIEGQLEQSARLAPPYEDVQEWFVRNNQGTPIIVYLCGAERITSRRPTVSMNARFYKQITFTARDGKQRSYPAFVGAQPQIIIAKTQPASSTSPALSQLWFIAGPVAAMLVVFIVLRIGVGRRKSGHAISARPRGRLREDDDDSAAADLPTDAVEALAELKRRAHHSR